MNPYHHYPPYNTDYQHPLFYQQQQQQYHNNNNNVRARGAETIDLTDGPSQPKRPKLKPAAPPLHPLLHDTHTPTNTTNTTNTASSDTQYTLLKVAKDPSTITLSKYDAVTSVTCLIPHNSHEPYSFHNTHTHTHTHTHNTSMLDQVVSNLLDLQCPTVEAPVVVHSGANAGSAADVNATHTHEQQAASTDAVTSAPEPLTIKDGVYETQTPLSVGALCEYFSNYSTNNNNNNTSNTDTNTNTTAFKIFQEIRTDHRSMGGGLVHVTIKCPADKRFGAVLDLMEKSGVTNNRAAGGGSNMDDITAAAVNNNFNNNNNNNNSSSVVTDSKKDNDNKMMMMIEDELSLKVAIDEVSARRLPLHLTCRFPFVLRPQGHDEEEDKENKEFPRCYQIHLKMRDLLMTDSSFVKKDNDDVNRTRNKNYPVVVDTIEDFLKTCLGGNGRIVCTRLSIKNAPLPSSSSSVDLQSKASTTAYAQLKNYLLRNKFHEFKEPPPIASPPKQHKKQILTTPAYHHRSLTSHLIVHKNTCLPRIDFQAYGQQYAASLHRKDVQICLIKDLGEWLGASLNGYEWKLRREKGPPPVNNLMNPAAATPLLPRHLAFQRDMDLTKITWKCENNEGYDGDSMINVSQFLPQLQTQILPLLYSTKTTTSSSSMLSSSSSEMTRPFVAIVIGVQDSRKLLVNTGEKNSSSVRGPTTAKGLMAIYTNPMTKNVFPDDNNTWFGVNLNC